MNVKEEENDLITAFRKLNADMRTVMLVHARSSLAAGRPRLPPPSAPAGG